MSRLPTTSEVFVRADEIAKRRHPAGCGATELANIVREAARELGLTQVRNPSERAKNPYEGRHNELSRLPEAQQIAAVRICAERSAASASPTSPPCVSKGFVCYHCQDLAAADVAEQSERTGA